MKKMNKKFVVGTAFAKDAAAALNGSEIPQPEVDVYGPPPSDEVEATEPLYGPPEIFDLDIEVQVPDYGPPEWEEEDEIPEILYGPPESDDLNDGD